MRITKKENHEPGDRHERKGQQPIAEDNWDRGQQDRYDYKWNSIANHVWNCFSDARVIKNKTGRNSGSVVPV